MAASDTEGQIDSQTDIQLPDLNVRPPMGKYVGYLGFYPQHDSVSTFGVEVAQSSQDSHRTQYESDNTCEHKHFGKYRNNVRYFHVLLGFALNSVLCFFCNFPNRFKNSLNMS